MARTTPRPRNGLCSASAAPNPRTKAKTGGADRPVNVFQVTLPEAGIGQDLLVVLDAVEIPLAGAGRRGVEREPDGVDQRVADDDQHDEHGRQDVDVVGPVAGDLAPADSACVAAPGRDRWASVALQRLP